MKHLKPRWGRIIVTILILIGIITQLWPTSHSIIATINGVPLSLEEFTIRYQFISFPLTPKEFYDQLLLEKAILLYIGDVPEVTNEEIKQAIETIKTTKQLDDQEFKKALGDDNISIKYLEELYYSELLTEKVNSVMKNFIEQQTTDENIFSLNGTNYTFEGLSVFTPEEISNVVEATQFQVKKKLVNDVINTTIVQTYLTFAEDKITILDSPQPYSLR